MKSRVSPRLGYKDRDILSAARFELITSLNTLLARISTLYGVTPHARLSLNDKIDG